jgi:multisubunit Na+/H+ antiporter MnhF subunit
MINFVAFLIGLIAVIFVHLIIRVIKAHRRDNNLLYLDQMSHEAEMIIEFILQQEDFESLLDVYAHGLVNFRYWEEYVNQRAYQYHVRSITEAYIQQRKTINPFQGESNSN